MLYHPEQISSKSEEMKGVLQGSPGRTWEWVIQNHEHLRQTTLGAPWATLFMCSRVCLVGRDN